MLSEEMIQFLTPEEAKLLELEGNATKGPWVPMPVNEKKWVQIEAKDLDLVINHDNDAMFVGACRAQIAGILASLAHARAALGMVKPAINLDSNEGTGHPWWAVVSKGSFGRFNMLAGPFFSRASATAFKEAQAHNLPKTAMVYCYSGQYCSGKGDWVHFLDAVRKAFLKKEGA